MGDIDQILAGGAGSSSRADFSAIADIPKAYWDGKEQRAKADLRDAFKNGVPTDASGNIDYGAIAKTLFQKGDIAGGTGLIGATAGAQDRAMLGSLDGQPQAQPAQAPLVSPPSANRTASAVVAPPLNKGGVAAPQGQGGPQGQGQPQRGPQGDQPGSIVGLVSAAGVPDELAGPIIQQASAALRSDPNAALNPQITPRAQQIVAEIVRRASAANQPQSMAQPPQAAPQPQGQPVPAQTVQVAPQNDQILKRLTFLAASPDKATAAAAKVRLEGYLKNQELTPDQKNAAASGQSLTDYQNRGDENTTQRDILTKSLLPKVDKSQESATAARDDINAIHRAREEIDQNGGVFSGAFADKKLYLAKVAELFGVKNADTITNTEAFSAAIGQRVAVMVKAFGSGTAISDGDRKFAEKMAGGNITLDETSMRRILDISEKANRGKIDAHNKLVDDVVGANDGLKAARKSYVVNAPGSYQKPELQKAAPQQQSATIGSKADYDKLPSGATFTGPDGKPWRKP